MTMLWWLLWPLSLVLCGWALYLTKGENNEMLCLSIMAASYSLTWKNRDRTSDSINNSPINTLFEWVIILIAPYVLLGAVLVAHTQQIALWPLESMAFIGLAITWGVSWVFRGLFPHL
jgi:hypothetical protein